MRTRPWIIAWRRGSGPCACSLVQEAVVHFTCGLEVAEQFGSHDSSFRCDVLVALAEAQGKIGDVTCANGNLDAAVSLARALGDAERLATAALRAGLLSELGVGGQTRRRSACSKRRAPCCPRTTPTSAPW